ncbi:hypothetical protein [Solirubrobacter soli]|uniref:hypothetical protein n=1 Tax=Solirubrobacter soli TaxID=363832 RepID=UPI000565D5DC|nr:hypothetical protein [Solirubrobacter soli]
MPARIARHPGRVARHPGWMVRSTRQTLEAVGRAFVVVALFPRTAAFVHAPGLFGPCGVLLHVVGWTLFLFGMG